MAQPAILFNHGGEEQLEQSELMEPFEHEPSGLVDPSKSEADDVPQGETMYASPPAFQPESVDAKDSNSMSASSSKPNTSLVSPPTSLADEMDGVQEGDAVQSVEGETSTALHTPNSSSRHSSRQPRHVDRFAPEAITARAPKPAARATSSTVGARKTTPPPPSTRKPSSRPSSSHAKKSSPMYEKHFHRHAPTSLSPRQHKHTQHLTGDEDADEESIRLIRELQEQEFGLRKRSTRA
jgi:F-box/leucine-rich repeat protein 10/11